MYGEALAMPRGDNFVQTLLNIELLGRRSDNVGDGVTEIVEFHCKEVLQSERLRIHVKVLPC